MKNKNFRHIQGRSGMTLLEVMFAALIMTVIMGGVFQAVIAVRANDRRSGVEAELRAAAVRTIERIQRGGDGLSGLIKAREDAVVVGAGGDSVDFTVDQNGVYTASAADDTPMRIYHLDADGVPATVEDDQVVFDPDTGTAGDEIVLCEGAASLVFEKNGRLVTVNIGVEREVRGRTVRLNVEQDLYLRNAS